LQGGGRQPITEAITAIGMVSEAAEPASSAASSTPKNDSPSAADAAAATPAITAGVRSSPGSTIEASTP